MKRLQLHVIRNDWVDEGIDQLSLRIILQRSRCVLSGVSLLLPAAAFWLSVWKAAGGQSAALAAHACSWGGLGSRHLYVLISLPYAPPQARLSPAVIDFLPLSPVEASGCRAALKNLLHTAAHLHTADL